MSHVLTQIMPYISGGSVLAAALPGSRPGTLMSCTPWLKASPVPLAAVRWMGCVHRWQL